MENILNAVYNKVENNDHIVVGVSGGVDSMVLLYALIQARATKPFGLEVVHVEHGIRGQASLDDAQFVADFCQKNYCLCHVVHIDVPTLAAKNKQTVEQCAREQRYAQFEKFMKKNSKLFVAHHKNDQAETVLMHIFRGSGIGGARGMLNSDNLVRPLLNFTKAEIMDFASSNNIGFVTDLTNDDCNYTRNFIRNKLLPEIEQIYPKVVENLSKFANFCNLSYNLIDSLITPDMLKHTKSGAQISKTALKTHPLVVAEVIKRAYNMCGEFADLESKHIDMIVEFYNTCKNGAVLNLPHGVVCEKRDGLLLYKLQAENIDECKFVLGDNVLPNGKTIVVSRITDFEFQDGKYYVDDDRLPSNLVWRTRRPGDVFGKLGSGKKKLNDYFTDKKIALPMRDKIILLASGSNILLVVGYDIAESVKVDHKTGLVLEIDCTQIM